MCAYFCCDIYILNVSPVLVLFKVLITAANKKTVDKLGDLCSSTKIPAIFTAESDQDLCNRIFQIWCKHLRQIKDDLNRLWWL